LIKGLEGLLATSLWLLATIEEKQCHPELAEGGNGK